MTTSVEGRNPVPRYQTIDDEFWDPKNRDLQARMSAKFQADMLIVVAQVRASQGGAGDMAAILGLDD